MFEYLVTVPWWVYCIMLTCGGAFFAIGMRFVDNGVNPSLFAALYTGIATVILFAFLVLLFINGEQIPYTGIAILVALFLGPVCVGVDLGVLAMYRAGAPVSLGMPLVRTLLALITALIGIVVFAEEMGFIKILGIVACSSGIFLMGQKEDEQKAA